MLLRSPKLTYESLGALVKLGRGDMIGQGWDLREGA